MIYKISAITIACLLLISLVLNYNQQSTIQANNNEYQLKYTEFEQQLQQLSRQRTLLVDSIARINSHLQNLDIANNRANTELKSVKGKYRKQTSSERAKQMIEEYERNK